MSALLLGQREVDSLRFRFQMTSPDKRWWIHFSVFHPASTLAIDHGTILAIGP